MPEGVLAPLTDDRRSALARLTSRRRSQTPRASSLDCHVVLDLGGPAAGAVADVRRRHSYAVHGALPVESTVVGSSGVGVIAADQDPEEVFAVLDEVAAATPPIVGTFGPALRFTDSDVFVLTLADEAPVRALHERLAASGLRFDHTPFPFTPHVTLRQGPPVDDDEAALLLATVVDQEFRFDMLSVYAAARLPLVLRHRAYLSGKT